MTTHRIVFSAVRHVLYACIAAAALGGITATSTAAIFTYQGVLTSAGAPINGTVDLKFRLYSSTVPLTPPLGSLAINGVAVTDGLFKVDIDFGPSAFNGTDRWLEIDVASPAAGGVGPFTTLTPRQQIGYAPMAQYALNATLSGTYANAVSFTAASNAFTGSGAGLTNLNPSSISSGTIGNALTLSSASNVFNGSGAGLTSLNAGNFGSGNLDVARLPQNGLWAINNPLRIDNSTFAIDPAADRVGIGTTLPQYTLHVIGDMSVDGATLNVDDNLNRVGIGVATPTHTLDVNGSLSVDGTTLNVDDNLNRVGIGTSAPAARLHVAGTTLLDGVMTFDGPATFVDVPSIPVTTRYVAIPAAGFRPNRETQSYLGEHYLWGQNVGSQFRCVAPVQVPHGATITNVNISLKDDSSNDMTVEVVRMNLVTGDDETLGSAVSLFALPTIRNLSIPLSHLADNSIGALYLLLTWTVPSSPSDMLIYGARVTYTIDQPLP